MEMQEIRKWTCDICGETKLCVCVESGGHYYYLDICEECARGIVEILSKKKM